jgi:hypothetical protein
MHKENTFWIKKHQEQANIEATPTAIAARQNALMGGAKPGDVPLRAYLPYPHLFCEGKKIIVSKTAYVDLMNSLDYILDPKISNFLEEGLARFTY